jgi:sugar/nucleoside kinase (ribokinase family)
VFAHDIRALGIRYTTPAINDGVPTARCLILVTPDAQRTMNTFLGASQFLPASALDPDLIASARMLYLEGYLWDPEEPRKAMRSAIDMARKSGREVAFTLSDNFCIARHREDFQALIDNGEIDVLFANEGEIKSLNQIDNFEKAVAATAGKVRTLVVTRSEKGAIAIQNGARHEVAAVPRPVRCGISDRLSERPPGWRQPGHGRGGGGGNHFALWRSSGSGPEGADG